jgi:hypothetical protein
MSSLFNGKCGKGNDPPGELAALTASSSLASSSFWSTSSRFSHKLVACKLEGYIHSSITERASEGASYRYMATSAAELGGSACCQSCSK